MTSVADFIEDYRATWETVIREEAEIGALDRFFNVPCFMVSLEGEPVMYPTQSNVTAFNQSRCDAFRAGGVRSAHVRRADVSRQGSHLSLAVVNWELLREDGSLERGWQHYYTILNETGDGPRIIVSAFQTGA